MSYVKKNSAKVIGSIAVVLLSAALAIWQFYLFVTLRDENGVIDVQGGTRHLWWAIGLALFACVASFLVFTAYAQYDRDDDLHITS
jgi:amino acid permease